MKKKIKILYLKKKTLKLFSRIAPHSKFRVFLLRLCGYSIGKDVFIGEDLIISDNLTDNNVIIKERASVGPRVTLVTSSGPNSSYIKKYINNVDGIIEIDKDAWIGAGVIILPNIKVGEGAIVGAGAVVTKDVKPYTIVVGVPAKFLKMVKDIV